MVDKHINNAILTWLETNFFINKRKKTKLSIDFVIPMKSMKKDSEFSLHVDQKNPTLVNKWDIKDVKD